MEVSELMIGDWIYNCFADIRFQVYPQFFSQWYNRPKQFKEIIHPIPLTSEILEKNGFKPYIPENHLETVYACQDVSKAVANELYALWPYQDGSFYLLLRVDGKDMVRMNIHYVHELQHALRLCGIEKTIEL